MLDCSSWSLGMLNFVCTYSQQHHVYSDRILQILLLDLPPPLLKSNVVKSRHRQGLPAHRAGVFAQPPSDILYRIGGPCPSGTTQSPSAGRESLFLTLSPTQSGRRLPDQSRRLPSSTIIWAGIESRANYRAAGKTGLMECRKPRWSARCSQATEHYILERCAALSSLPKCLHPFA